MTLDRNWGEPDAVLEDGVMLRVSGVMQTVLHLHFGYVGPGMRLPASYQLGIIPRW